MIENQPCSRREAIAGTLAIAAGVGLLPVPPDAAASHLDAGDFAFLMGSWRVRHHKLNGRMVGSTDWADFEGTTHAWSLLGGVANVDDNLLYDPSGTYRGISLRRYDAALRQWSIWWMDNRSSTLFPPVVGAFKDGVGTFLGDDELRGQPILVRFIWSDLTASSARWEQAFSADRGITWEINWIMQLHRA
jgi:hypothetical protein